jgi:hypothetical protein
MTKEVIIFHPMDFTAHVALLLITHGTTKLNLEKIKKCIT